jgi:1-acyl-sn-glycerol-3-phosphate acyltransferase
LFEAFFKWFYKFRGWTLGDNLPPDMKKCVVIVAPHTSGWDFVYGAGAKLLLPLDAIYLAKKELFRWPLKNMFLRLGGVPVDRSRNLGLTDSMIEYIKTHEVAHVVFPPEGTRKRVTRWRKGFYYAALGASVPIAMAYIDFKEKKAGIGPSFMPTGDIEKDFDIIREFYKNITACKPENFAPPEVKP